MKITKKSLAFIIIIVAALALIIAAVIFIPRIINRQSGGQIREISTTVIECNVGQTLSDSDLKEIENIVRGIVSDKFISAEKAEGFAPMLNLEARGYDIENMSEEEYESTRRDLIGDRLILTCAPLTEDEWLKIYTAIAEHFDFERTGDTLHNRQIRNLFGIDPD